MGQLILIRHGETNKNVSKKLHAFGDQESLNKKGISQILGAARKLKKFSPYKIYSSKEKRAIESAELISKTLRLPYHLVKGLEERNWGIFTDKPWESVKKVLEPMTLEERYKYVPEGGESWQEFETRLIGVIKTITKGVDSRTIVVVTHGGAIRALMPFLLGVPKEESFKYDPDNASMTIFNFEGGKFREIVVNDTSYLNNL